MNYRHFILALLAIFSLSIHFFAQEPDAADNIEKYLKELKASMGDSVAPMVANVITNAEITIDCSMEQGELLHPEKYNNFSHSLAFVQERDADVRFYNEQGLHGKIYRVWLNEHRYFDEATGNIDISEVSDYLSDASRISDNLLINCTAAGVAGDWGLSPEDSRKRLARILAELKKNYPKIKYVEVTNEPDYSKIVTPDTYYNVYKVFYQVVNDINAELKPAVPLEVGGPATAQFNLPWIEAFLDAYVNDSAPEKRIDFISYHGYFTKPGAFYIMFKDNPSLVKDQRNLLDEELTIRGISRVIPVFITEMGLYPGPSFDDIQNMKNDHLRQAAGMASLFYWYMSSSKTYPFNWVLRHRKEGRKDQLVSRDEREQALVYTYKFTPYGNMLIMLSKMKKNRISATTSSDITEGKGLYTLAAADSSGISVMVWNFQSKNMEGFNAEIKVKNLPVSFRNKNVRAMLYRIDTKTSNYHANIDNCNLQMVDDKIVNLDGAYYTSMFLEPNTLQLLILEPVNEKALY